MTLNDPREILTKYRIVAVVGLSREPDKASYAVGAYLKEHGFRVIPVNPFAQEVLGEKSYKSLLEMPAEIQKTLEVVDIFRPAKDILPIVEQAIKLREKHGKPYVIWMQLGIVNEQAAEVAKRAGFRVIMDRCIMQDHASILESEVHNNSKPYQ